MTEVFDFVDATPEAEKARIALQGPSGCGKTWTALRIANGLGGTIGLVDTEKRSARKYGRQFQFKTLDIAHYDPMNLVRAIAKAAERRIDVLIIDSFSHFWSGKGGMLAKVDELSGSNKWGGWKDVRPIEQNMLDALLSFPGHLIVTMRVKTEWVVEERGNKKVPVKIGLKPDQRENLDYEFDVVGELDLSHTLTVSKSRVVDVPVGSVVPMAGEEFGKQIADWLGTGTAMSNANDFRDRAVDKNADRESLLALYQEVQQRGLLGAAVVDDTGEAVSLGALITKRGQQLAAARPAEAAA